MDQDETYAACPACFRFLERETEQDAHDLVEMHNDSQHDGSEVAVVLNTTVQELGEFFAHAKQACNDDQYYQLTRVFRGYGEMDQPFFVSGADWEEIVEIQEGILDG